jgi:hypothetical protein
LNNAEIRVAELTGARAVALLLALVCTVACGVWAMPDSHGRERQASGGGRRIEAGPDNYLGRLRRLKAGDTLVLAPGSYDNPDYVPGLPIFDLHGKTAGQLR